MGEIQAERLQRAFKAGLAVGFIASALIFALVMWLWIIPTMDGAVATAKTAYGAVSA